MFAHSASLAVMALLGLHGIDMVDAKVLIGGSSLPGLRAQAGTPAPSASPVSPQPTLPVPTGSPSDSPAPSPAPSDSPTVKPPTTSPSASPAPSPSPSSTPTLTKMPTPFPTSGPPTVAPVVTAVPSASPKPSPSPSGSPSTPAPTTTPSDSPQPSPGPTRNTPTGVPSVSAVPTGSPSGSPKPSPMPTTGPTPLASAAPSKSPAPTGNPTASPAPSPGPTLKPTTSKQPTPGPTALPTVSNEPSLTTVPSMTFVPSLGDTVSAEPSVSNVPSTTPSFSDEPSVSDVPTVSNNPTASAQSFVDFTLSFQGITNIVIRFPEIGSCIDENGAPVAATGNPPGSASSVTTVNYRCTNVITTDDAPYTFTVTQATVPEAGSNGSTNRGFPYTVDFKVNGETVPDLSGVMQFTGTQPITTTTASDPDVRTFSFTNHIGEENQNAVVNTELSPAPNGNYLEFTATSVTDTLDILTLDAPRLLDGTTSSCDISITTPTVVTIICKAFTSTGGLYTFDLQVTDNNGDSVVSDDIPVLTTSDGTSVTPGFAIPADTPLNPTIDGVYQYRSDSRDAPVVPSQLEWPFLLTVSTSSVRRQMLRSSPTESNHRSLQIMPTLTLVSPAAIANCVVGGPFQATATTTVTYISCEEYVPGAYVFTLMDGESSSVYGMFYDGAIVEALSGADATYDSFTFEFTAPETQGDALIAVDIDLTPLAPTASPAPSVSPAPTLGPTSSPAPSVSPAPTLGPTSSPAPSVSPAPTDGPTATPAPSG